MRRDSRIGMAIGGVLVAVLLVYAVVVPKNNKKKVVVELIMKFVVTFVSFVVALKFHIIQQ